ncbi:MAG: HD-GYP domain-containing protein [Dehalococcoidia bacterium]
MDDKAVQPKRWTSLVGRLTGGRRRTEAVSNRLALRRHYFGGHSLRARQYALTLADQLRLPEDMRTALSLAGYVYDTGSLQIQDEVLLHPGPLDDQQQDAIKAHVFRGCSMIRESGLFDGLPQQLVDTVYDIILFHHERYDGNGYPYGLKGESVPYLARIMAIADSFSAMTSKRPHREALSELEALEEIEKGIGTQFDPELDEIFVRMMERLVALNEDQD